MITLIILLLSGIICFFHVLKWDVEEDFQKWKLGIEVIHKQEAWIRIVYLLFPYWCFTMAACVGLSIKGFTLKGEVEWLSASLSVLSVIVLPIAMMGFCWVLFFDGWYNRKRGFGFWFNGSPKGKTDDSIFDKFWRKVPTGWERVIKIGMSIISTLLYIRLIF